MKLIHLCLIASIAAVALMAGCVPKRVYEHDMAKVKDSLAVCSARNDALNRRVHELKTDLFRVGKATTPGGWDDVNGNEEWQK